MSRQKHSYYIKNITNHALFTQLCLRSEQDCGENIIMHHLISHTISLFFDEGFTNIVVRIHDRLVSTEDDATW